jgi:hypothetical protein
MRLPPGPTDDNEYDDPTVTEAFEATTEVEGTFYIQVVDGSGSYTLEIQ